MNTTDPTGPRKITPQDPPKFPCWLKLRSTGWNYFFGSKWAEMAAAEDATEWCDHRPDQPTAPATPPPAGTETADHNLLERIETDAQEIGSLMQENATLRHELAAVTALLEKRTVTLERAQKCISDNADAMEARHMFPGTVQDMKAVIVEASSALSATPEQALKEKEGAS